MLKYNKIPLAVRIHFKFGYSEITASDLVKAFSHLYSENYLKTILSNSEIDSTHSLNYVKNTIRVDKGVYIQYL